MKTYTEEEVRLVIAGMQAEIDALKLVQQEQAGWQPIETAPKDGTDIWCFDSLYGKPWHYEANWNGIQWYHGFGDSWPDANPTHWQPLTAAPKGEKP